VIYSSGSTLKAESEMHLKCAREAVNSNLGIAGVGEPYPSSIPALCPSLYVEGPRKHGTV